MDLTPIDISLLALLVSVISLAVALYNTRVDRRIQLEHLKGEMMNRLTSRGIEILSHIEKLSLYPSEAVCEQCRQLIRVSEGIIEVRRVLKKFPELPLFPSSSALLQLQKARSSIEDAEPVFDRLGQAVSTLNLEEIGRISDGLVERLLGSSNSDELSLPNPLSKKDA
jgi:hypothetical protein